MAGATRTARRERAVGVRELSPALHERIAKAIAETKEQLLASDPTIGSDPALLRDMLDGEGDGVDGIRRLIRASITCDDLADEATAAAKVYRERAAECSQRAERHKRRKEKLREVAYELMKLANIEGFTEGDFSAWFQDLPRQLTGEPDVAKLPDEFLIYQDPKVKRKELLDALLAGREIEGAPSLTNTRDHLVVKVT